MVPGGIAPGRNEFMSTQRRDCRSARRTGKGSMSLRCGSRLAVGEDRVTGGVWAEMVWTFFAYAAGLMAIAARIPLRQDRRNSRRDRFQWHVWSLSSGLPPFRQANVSKASLDCSTGYLPILSPAVFARSHRTLPLVPAAQSSWMERYDGKGNLHFKHAA